MRKYAPADSRYRRPSPFRHSSRKRAGPRTHRPTRSDRIPRVQVKYFWEPRTEKATLEHASTDERLVISRDRRGRGAKLQGAHCHYCARISIFFSARACAGSAKHNKGIPLLPLKQAAAHRCADTPRILRRPRFRFTVRFDLRGDRRIGGLTASSRGQSLDQSAPESAPGLPVAVEIFEMHLFTVEGKTGDERETFRSPGIRAMPLAAWAWWSRPGFQGGARALRSRLIRQFDTAPGDGLGLTREQRFQKSFPNGI